MDKETWIEFIKRFPMCNKKCTICYQNGLLIKSFYLYHIEDFTDEQLNFLIVELQKYINNRAITYKKLDRFFHHDNKTN